jgi:hypothetical protein
MFYPSLSWEKYRNYVQVKKGRYWEKHTSIGDFQQAMTPEGNRFFSTTPRQCATKPWSRWDLPWASSSRWLCLAMASQRCPKWWKMISRNILSMTSLIEISNHRNILYTYIYILYMIFYMILMSDVQNDSEIGPLLHAVCEVAGRGCGCSRPSREVSLKSRPDAEIAKKKTCFFSYRNGWFYGEIRY